MSPDNLEHLKFRPVVQSLTSNPGADMIRYARGQEGLLWLGQGEGDVPTPDFIVNTTIKAMQDGLMFYGPALGSPYLRQALSEYYQNIFGFNIPTSRIFVTQSGSNAMHISLSSLLDKGDEVVAVTPIWKNLLGAVELMQANIKEVALDDTPESWSLDLDKLFDACTDKTRVLLLVSPSNPTGWTASDEEIKQILDFCRERGIWIIADEVYNRLTFNALRAPSFLDHAKPTDRLLVVNSFSKTWAMTGWRLGWIVGPEESEDLIRDVALYNNLCPQPFTQRGGIAALEQGEDFIKEQKTLWRSNRDLVYQRFEESGRIHIKKTDATFYGFFKVDGEPDCYALTKRFVDESKVALSPGCAFGKSGFGYVRMCFAISEKRLNEALDKMLGIL
ncbi:MAG: pyridoxal phosphate-dependent aminotransferase [Alphaproteobacteria bacterium]